MKITRVETIVVSMPMLIEGTVVPKTSGAPRTTMETLLVRVDTDAGLSGWGEGFGHRIYTATKAAIDGFIGPMCVGRDATAIDTLADDLERNLHGVGRNGPAMYALSAIDIALWDIAGKAAGLPLYRLLGGSAAGTLPGYASLLRYGDPAAVTHYVERALGRGYRQLKLHEIETRNIAAGRAAAGSDVRLMVDCNCPWTVDVAIARARELAPLGLAWLEEPVWPPEDEAGLTRVRSAGGIPTAAGENAMLRDFQRLFEAGALAYAQPSVTKVGGITGMRRVAAAAQAHGVTIAPHSAYFGPGFLATLHCIAALAPGASVERYDADFPVNPLHGAILPDARGEFAVPQGPGLGVDPDPEVIARQRIA